MFIGIMRSPALLHQTLLLAAVNHILPSKPHVKPFLRMRADTAYIDIDIDIDIYIYMYTLGVMKQSGMQNHATKGTELRVRSDEQSS